MRLEQIEPIAEVSVISSWIQDLDYIGDNVVLMTLNNGRQYRVLGVGEGLFRQWVSAPSKGKFWHSNIKGNYRVSRT
jgi:hypothetical protein